MQRVEVGAGSVLAGRYELLSVLGRGGMGIVFRAVHLGTDRPIAVKVLRRELMADPTLAKRFVREAKAAAAIQHPNVVDVLDYGVDEDGTAFQVLELLEGASLGEQLTSKGRLPVDVTLALLLPVIHALTVAHARGVIHRDLKPDNIFLARNAHGRIVPKLLDFGIAKLLQVPGAVASTLATRVGTAIGTPAYMSPEQASGTADVGVTTDVWAIGVILFECLTGRLPFEAEIGAILMARIITEQAPSISAVAPETPPALARVIDRALAAKSEDRWATMVELAAALRDAATELGIDLGPAGASDTAAMSLPPPRSEADREAPERAPISSGDDLDAAHGLTRDHQSGTVTKELRPRRMAVGGRPSPMDGPPSGPITLAERPPLPVARIVLASLVLVALVSLGLWMRAPAPTEAATGAPALQAPIAGARAVPAIEPDVASLPEAIAPPVEARVEATVEATVEAPELAAPTEAPAAPPLEVRPPRDRRRASPPARDEPTTTRAERARAPGSQLPALTEW